MHIRKESTNLKKMGQFFLLHTEKLQMYMYVLLLFLYSYPGLRTKRVLQEIDHKMMSHACQNNTRPIALSIDLSLVYLGFAQVPRCWYV